MVAVLEIVSPGNKSSQREFRRFVEKAVAVLQNGIHLLIIDLFPPTPRDPQGIHGSIWSELGEEDFDLPPDKPLTLAAYARGENVTAFVEPAAVGDALTEMPLFLTEEDYVEAPLEKTYLEAWQGVPRHLQQMLER